MGDPFLKLSNPVCDRSTESVRKVNLSERSGSRVGHNHQARIDLMHVITQIAEERSDLNAVTA